MRVRSLAIVVFTLGLAFLLPGCKDSKGAAAYNQQLIGAQNRVKSGQDKFIQTLTKVAQEGPQHIPQLRLERKSFQETIASVRADFKSWPVPDRPSGHAFAAAFDKFLVTEEEIASKDLEEVIKIWEAAPIQQREAKLKDVVKRAEDREKAAMAEVQSTQQAFFKDYNIKMIK